MEFQEIFTDRDIVFSVLWPALIFFGLGLIVFNGNEILSYGATKGVVAALLCGVIFLAGSVFTYYQGIETRKSNNAALVSNLQQKYDVDEVLLEDLDTKVVSEKEGKQKINVVSDGVTYTFLLTQDKNTWEPTLSNPAIPGGSAKETNVSAEDLLK